MPKSDDPFVAPLKLGKKSLAASVLKSTDRDRMRRQVIDWGPEKNRTLVGLYRKIEQLEFGSTFPMTDMTLSMKNRTDPVHFWALRLPVKMLGEDAPAALCFAFECSSAKPGKNLMGSDTDALMTS